MAKYEITYPQTIFFAVENLFIKNRRGKKKQQTRTWIIMSQSDPAFKKKENCKLI